MKKLSIKETFNRLTKRNGKIYFNCESLVCHINCPFYNGIECVGTNRHKEPREFYNNFNKIEMIDEILK